MGGFRESLCILPSFRVVKIASEARAASAPAKAAPLPAAEGMGSWSFIGERFLRNLVRKITRLFRGGTLTQFEGVQFAIVMTFEHGVRTA